MTQGKMNFHPLILLLCESYPVFLNPPSTVRLLRFREAVYTANATQLSKQWDGNRALDLNHSTGPPPPRLPMLNNL